MHMMFMCTQGAKVPGKWCVHAWKPHVALGLRLVAVLPHDLLEGHTQLQDLHQSGSTHTDGQTHTSQLLCTLDMT